MNNGENQPAKSAEQPKLRHEFVGMMFALAIGEVGLQTASLVQAGRFYHFLPAYSHLILGTIVIATSWVGWSLSLAPGGREDVKGIFQWEFIVLLLDVALVITYFILVRTIDFSKTEHRIDPASKVALLVFSIFCLYFVWDLISKVAVYLTKREGDWWRKYGSRMIPTVFCLITAWFVWQCVKGSDVPHELSTDFALLCLILLFRSLKDWVSAVFPSGSARKSSLAKAVAWSLVLFCGIILGTLATQGSWHLPLGNDVLTQIKAPD